MKTKKYLKIAVLVAVAAIFVWTFVFLWQKSRPEAIVYNLATPEVTDLEKTTVATGKVEPRDEVLIKPQISGIIDQLYKEAGQTVRKGEVIAKVKVIPELGTLNSAESRVRLAEINGAQAETDFRRLETASSATRSMRKAASPSSRPAKNCRPRAITATSCATASRRAAPTSRAPSSAAPSTGLSWTYPSRWATASSWPTP